jgi:two-component system phosphate regulon sensor histidine kinase PhoR
VGSRSLQVRARPLGDGGSDQAVVLVIDTTEPRRLERLRRDFVANASHELRTPVAAIVGAAETLQAGAADDPEARRSFVAILQRHARRLSQLTADLLDIARLEAGYRPRLERVSVREAVEGVLQPLQRRADDKRLRLGSAIDDSLMVSAERAALDQILSNLVDNAIKYTPEGGRVTVRVARATERIELCVEDTGPGIAAEHLPRLFERFYRVDDARSRELGGTGLGLAIVKHLALANAGEVRVESQLGRGSRFYVLLPAA